MKSKIEEQAALWVELNPDREVRRMYGHYYRAFLAGAKQQQVNTNVTPEKINKMRDALEVAMSALSKHEDCKQCDRAFEQVEDALTCK